MRIAPDFLREAEWHARGRMRVAGVDEVGRGPLAGPVVAAAVVLDPRRLPAGVDDSKRLSPGARARAAALIHESAEIGLGEASVEEIDRLNIAGATHLAMRRALAALPRPPDHALIDGNRLPDGLPCPAEAVVGGDGRVLSIAAASVIAKLWRDRLMVALAQQWPGYGWERNMGYGSESHIRALHDLGPSPFHRRSFAPLRQMLCPASP